MSSLYEMIMGTFDEQEVPNDLEYPDDSELMKFEWKESEIWKHWYPNGLPVFRVRDRTVTIVDLKVSDLINLSDWYYQKSMRLDRSQNLRKYHRQICDLLLYEQRRRQMPR